jgi:hypothetical protein
MRSRELMSSDRESRTLFAGSLDESVDSFEQYGLLTLDQIVDVLCSKPPEASWVNGMES